MENINENDQVLLDEFNSDDDPIDEVKDSLKQALLEVKQGKTRPISELWERINE